MASPVRGDHQGVSSAILYKVAGRLWSPEDEERTRSSGVLEVVGSGGLCVVLYPLQSGVFSILVIPVVRCAVRSYAELHMLNDADVLSPFVPPAIRLYTLDYCGSPNLMHDLLYLNNALLSSLQPIPPFPALPGVIPAPP
jgi:hypothetical protein